MRVDRSRIFAIAQGLLLECAETSRRHTNGGGVISGAVAIRAKLCAQFTSPFTVQSAGRKYPIPSDSGGRRNILIQLCCSVACEVACVRWHGLRVWNCEPAAPNPSMKTKHSEKYSQNAATESGVDKELVRRFLGGDESAFVTIIQRYQSKIFAIAQSLLHNHSDAEESRPGHFCAGPSESRPVPRRFLARDLAAPHRPQPGRQALLVFFPAPPHVHPVARFSDG